MAQGVLLTIDTQNHKGQLIYLFNVESGNIHTMTWYTYSYYTVIIYNLVTSNLDIFHFYGFRPIKFLAKISTK